MRTAGRTVVMVTSSYPRFPGDAIATFMEPIAKGIAARSDAVHVVAPWHPRWSRATSEGNLHFHLFRYAPAVRLNVFGYAGALRADVRLRASAIAMAPLAMVSGVHRARQVARDTRASIVHAHWVIPGGVIGAVVAGRRPLVISLHGSDMFVAERHRLAGLAARAAFRRADWVTTCSDDLRNRAVAIGASPDRVTVVPYGVDSERFRPSPEARAQSRAALGVAGNALLVFAFGRLVEKKGFEYLIAAAALLKHDYPALRVVIAGDGDLAAPLRAQASAAGVGDRVQFLGDVSHERVPALLAAADVAIAPSIRGEEGNVDGLPNTVLEIMASATPLVTTSVGGISAVATDGLTARLVPERDARAIADAIASLRGDPGRAIAIGRRARAAVCRDYSWTRVAEQFDAIYERVLAAGKTGR